MYIKYFTNAQFNKDEFTKLLRYVMNVKAAPVEDGIILDLEAFNSVPKGAMPHWAFINSRFINSKLHTREATREEYKIAASKYRPVLYYIIRDSWYNEFDRVTAQEWDKLKAKYPDRYDFIGSDFEE